MEFSLPELDRKPARFGAVDWEAHKTAIEELYNSNELLQIKEIMERRHGFLATYVQLPAGINGYLAADGPDQRRHVQEAVRQVEMEQECHQQSNDRHLWYQKTA